MFTDDDNNTYEWHCRKDAVQDPEKVLTLIFRRMYPDCPRIRSRTYITIQTWVNRQIADGNEVNKIDWVSTHPGPTLRERVTAIEQHLNL